MKIIQAIITLIKGDSLISNHRILVKKNYWLKLIEDIFKQIVQ
jgi:hypothetical protein